MAYHGPSGPMLRSGPVWQPRERGIRGVSLGFNPNSPRPSLLCVAVPSGNIHRFPTSSPPPPRCASPAQRADAAPLLSTPPPTPPLPPWTSRPVRKIPSPRSMTWAARFHEVGEAAKDLAPDGAPEWWLLTSGSGMLWW
jgi:hypothetical protein